MSYGLGHIPDPDGHLATGSHHYFGAIGSLPKAATLRDLVDIQDQQDTNSCVGQATGQCIYVTMRKSGSWDPSHSFPSGQGIYGLARCIDRISSTTPLEDVGSMPNQAMRGLTEYGIPLSSDWPFDPSTINDEPFLDELMKASRLKMLGYYRVDSDDVLIPRCKQAISSGVAVGIATQVDRAFEDYNGIGVLTAPGASMGGHYLALVGYETLSSGKTVFEIANSWGTSYGDKGFARCDEAWLRKTVDRYVTKVHPVIP